MLLFRSETRRLWGICMESCLVVFGRASWRLVLGYRAAILTHALGFVDLTTFRSQWLGLFTNGLVFSTALVTSGTSL